MQKNDSDISYVYMSQDTMTQYLELSSQILSSHGRKSLYLFLNVRQGMGVYRMAS